MKRWGKRVEDKYKAGEEVSKRRKELRKKKKDKESPASWNTRLKEFIFWLVKSLYLVFCILLNYLFQLYVTEYWKLRLVLISIEVAIPSKTLHSLIYTLFLIYKYNIRMACWVLLWLDTLEIAIVGTIEPCWLHSNVGEPKSITTGKKAWWGWIFGWKH